MTKEEEIRMINEKLDFYVMEASDEEFDTEEVTGSYDLCGGKSRYFREFRILSISCQLL